MLSSALSLTLLASLATASPLARRQDASVYPPRTTAQAFTLVANVTNPATDFFNPAVQNWAVTGVHVGAGLNAAVLNNGPGSVFFVNGTGQDVSRLTTSIALPPLNGSTPAPMGMQFTVSTTTSTDGLPAGAEAGVSMNIGTGTIGAGIPTDERSPVPSAFGAYGGQFMVCQISNAAAENPQYQIRMALNENPIPSTCVEVTLLAQCAELPALSDVAELNIQVTPVQCYEDVASIDWTQYSAI